MANPWDNDPITKDASAASAEQSNTPWANDPIVGQTTVPVATQSDTPWANDPIVGQTTVPSTEQTTTSKKEKPGFLRETVGDFGVGVVKGVVGLGGSCCRTIRHTYHGICG
jgi:hypothetical protein